MYCIHEKYIGRKKITHYDARKDKDEWQDYTYKRAFDLSVERGYNKILDVGCGNGYKLMKYFQDKYTVGIEVGPCLNFLKNKYADKLWYEDLNSISEKFDIVTCADVIEHIEEPTGFLNSLNLIDFELLILSTPNRDNVPGNHLVSTNPAHYREWNIPELRSYISQHFKIIEHFGSQEAIDKFYLPEDTKSFMDADYGQCVVCEKLS